MKKILLLILALTIFTVACNAGSEYSPELPIHENMKLESTQKNEVEGIKVTTSTYLLENESLDTFLFEYEKALNEAGWETINDLKPRAIIVEKEGDKATVLVYEMEDKLLVDLIPIVEKAKE